MDPTWIVRLDAPGDGPRLAVKDCIDACCGIAGLKTTWGRVPLDGVYPLAPSLDTVGPLGADVAAVELGMGLIEPGFAAGSCELIAGRMRPEIDVDPMTDAAVDAALAAAGAAGLSASLQLIGPPGGEERLIALGRVIEAALR